MAALQVRNLTEGFGAEVRGLDTGREFDDETKRTLRKLFDERSALVFPGLDIDAAYQDKLCRMLIGDDGPPTRTDRAPTLVSNKEEGANAPYGRLMFHADMMWHPQPFQVLSLYATNVQPGSATTSLASATRAWEILPADLRARIEGREAVHITGQVYSRGGDDLLRPEREREESTAKPIPYIHPRTGKPILYVSQQMTREIAGMPAEESESLLQELFDHIYAPANLYEHSWTNGDLLVFDNIALQHARSYVDPNGPTRTLRKVIAPIPKVSFSSPKYAKAS
jgi:alpha-ketoglutarate-dependent taurine dioxygenase